MFNLLVKSSGWGKSSDSIGKDRVFEHTDDDLVNQYNPKGKLDSVALSQLPTLFLTESGGNRKEFARVGYIRRISSIGREVNLEYVIDTDIALIPNDALEEIALELGIGNTFEFRRTHWAVKDVDLFKALFKIRSSPAIAPKLFNVVGPTAVDKDLLSVMMPFDAEFDKVYSALKRMAKELRMNCLRADDIWDHDVVIQDIVSLIDKSSIVICDCSGRNSNVFYEIGIAHSLGKQVILISQSKDDIPFDLKHIRYVRYLNNPEGRRNLMKKIGERIVNLGV